MTDRARESDEIDPRITRSKAVIRRAALEELAAVGWGAFTIESVAARAGVGKSTIYRHWRTKLSLVGDAFESLNRQPAPPPAGGTPRERVTALVQHFAEVMGDSIFSDCLPALIEAASQHPEVAEFYHEYGARRRGALVRALRDGVSSGDFPRHVDPDLAALALAGTVIYCRLITPESFNPARAEALVTSVLGPPPARSRNR